VGLLKELTGKANEIANNSKCLLVSEITKKLNGRNIRSTYLRSPKLLRHSSALEERFSPLPTDSRQTMTMQWDIKNSLRDSTEVDRVIARRDSAMTTNVARLMLPSSCCPGVSHFLHAPSNDGRTKQRVAPEFTTAKPLVRLTLQRRLISIWIRCLSAFVDSKRRFWDFVLYNFAKTSRLWTIFDRKDQETTDY